MSQRYRIQGIEGKHNDPIELIISAENVEEALAKSGALGITIVALELAPRPNIAPPPIPRVTQSKLVALSNRATVPQTPKTSLNKWLVMLALTMFVVGLMVPIVFLLWGMAIATTCIAMYFDEYQSVACKLLRIDSKSKRDTYMKLALYGCCSVLLIWLGVSLEENRKAREITVARDADQKAENIRLANNANTTVESILAEAISAAESGNVEIAAQKVESALSVPYATTLEAVVKLREFIDFALDREKVKSALESTPDDVFSELKLRGTIPPRLISGHDGLDLAIANNVNEAMPDVEVLRESKLAAAMEVERKLEETRRAALEMEKKKEEELVAQKNAEKAKREKEAATRGEVYLAELKSADVRLIYAVSVRAIGADGWEAILTVENLWHVRNKQIRLQDAQVLWQVWAAIASPKDLDSARIKIVDKQGNEVGGSRILAGSLIWVQ